MPTTAPSNLVTTSSFGSIGLGIAAAIGAATAKPDQLTVVVTGDGGGAMGLMELATAVQEQLKVVHIMFNDLAYGAEWTGFLRHDFDPELSRKRWPDFVSVVRSLGGDGVTVRTVPELEAACAAAVASTTSFIIDVRCDPQFDPRD
jgi:thiamine pyrophosphate-dependent acetolactate synthase large subunit-like protein